jgi:hypothetical protein
MAAIDIGTLPDEAKCYACFAPEYVPELSKLALLSRISDLSQGTSWITSFTGNTTRNNFTGVVGGTLTVAAAPITVSHLGCHIVAGGTKIHTLRLHTTACVVVASGTIDFTGLSGFNYVAVTPAILSAATAYWLSLSVVTGEDFWWEDLGCVIVTTPVATLGASRFGPAITCPSNSGNPATEWAGVNFKYTSP